MFSVTTAVGVAAERSVWECAAGRRCQRVLGPTGSDRMEHVLALIPTWTLKVSFCRRMGQVLFVKQLGTQFLERTDKIYFSYG